jgi:hypothetical protein
VDYKNEIIAMGWPDISIARQSQQQRLKDLSKLRRLSYKNNKDKTV